ncbi:hypothetical protein DIPPA_05685 [Diplonema papillatum]|nr:hypothetical protein DIPPA_05685 [Diplonema papillatum]|eukprot:gene19375-29838_t
MSPSGSLVAVVLLLFTMFPGGSSSVVTLASEGRLVYVTRKGIYEVQFTASTPKRLLKFDVECTGRGIGYDEQTRSFLWACDDRRLYYADMSVADPTVVDLTASSSANRQYLKTGITCTGTGTCFYSEFRDVGWRVLIVDMDKGELTGKEQFSLKAEQDYGGGLVVHQGIVYLSYETNQLGHIAYQAGSSYISIDHVEYAWTTSRPIGVPTSWKDILLVPMITEKTGSLLYRVDVTDSSPLELLPIPLPAYDTYQSTGFPDGNRQAAVVLVSETVVAYSDDTKIYLATFNGNGTDKELLLDLYATDVGPMLYMPPGTTWAPTTAPATGVPPTRAPDTLAPPTEAPPTIGPTYAPTRAPVVWVESPFENPGNQGTIADETAVPPSPEEQAAQAAEEEKQAKLWPIGNGTKAPMLVAMFGLIICGVGLIAVLVAQPSCRKVPPLVIPTEEPEESDKLYREMNDTHGCVSDPASDKHEHEAQSLSSFATSPCPKQKPTQAVILALPDDDGCIVTRSQRLSLNRHALAALERQGGPDGSDHSVDILA